MTNVLTKKYGPLPGWAWGVAGVGGIALGLWWKHRGDVTSSSLAPITDPAVGDTYPVDVTGSGALPGGTSLDGQQYGSFTGLDTPPDWWDQPPSWWDTLVPGGDNQDGTGGGGSGGPAETPPTSHRGTTRTQEHRCPPGKYWNGHHCVSNAGSRAGRYPCGPGWHWNGHRCVRNHKGAVADPAHQGRPTNSTYRPPTYHAPAIFSPLSLLTSTQLAATRGFVTSPLRTTTVRRRLYGGRLI